MIRQKRMYECTLCGTLDQLDVLCDGTPEQKHKACRMTPITVFYGLEVEALVEQAERRDHVRTYLGGDA